MKEMPSEFQPDLELADALRSALEPKGDHAAFVARVMAQYDQALDRTTVPTLDVLASWFRPGIAAAVAYLSRELRLNAAQRDSVRAIIARHRPETDALWARVRPQFDSIKARMRAEIDAQLTPEQRTRHQQLIDQAEHLRREREGRARSEEHTSELQSPDHLVCRLLLEKK